MGILAASEFAIQCTENRLKGYTTRPLIFYRDMILLIKHNADLELIHQ